MTAELIENARQLQQRQTDLLKDARNADARAKRLEHNAALIVSEASGSDTKAAQKLVATHLRRLAKLERDSATRQRRLSGKYAELRKRYLKLINT